MDIGAKIRQLRLKNKMSQEQLACQLAITQKSVSNIEAGETIPDFLLMDKVCKIFNVGFEYFLSEVKQTNNVNHNNGTIAYSVGNINNTWTEDILKRIEQLEKIILEKRNTH